MCVTLNTQRSPSLICVLGPTCKKMNDLSTPKTFKSAAFEPSEEDVYNAARDKRKQRLGKKRGAGSASRSKVKHEDSDDMEEPKQVVKRRFTGLPADLDDSSDEMPDLSIKDLFAERDAKKEAKKVVKKEVSKVKAEGKKRLKKKRKLVIPPSDVGVHTTPFLRASAKPFPSTGRDC